MNGTWDQFSMVARLWTAELQRPPSGVPPMCDHYYMEWFNRYSDLRLIADLDHSDDDYVPPPTAMEAWMGKIMQDVQKLSLEKDNMSATVRAVVDSLEQTLAH
ncbi:uncharacterized protein LOC110686315 [Chenopodium quinoa]|uniref:uncharacterized protein LOC110686315 n=1 Tax=Chenopodium quinoa TaxID=63459 RepID=UPI000B78D347|nr:uncharacterized protein LOC110686315 [Chenopodium quinoa]